ncbi:MAG: 4Fe-4S binding protein [Deltaproteobacteria bacterium]|jgi:ferredoxin|nr:4Fe-4S binding protein [Deltaproteobacteria bacterium]
MAYEVIRNAMVYFSPTGSVRAIARSISQGVAINPREFDLTLPSVRERKVTLEDAEFVLLAFPVYGGRLPAIMRAYISQLPRGKRPVAAVVVYGNVGFGDALLELYDLCVSRDFDVVAAAAFIGEHAYSSVLGSKRPNEADKERARVFGVGIRQALFTDGNIVRSILSKGSGATSKPPQLPSQITFMLRPRSCESCRNCVYSCPVSAFINNDPANIDYDKCIGCGACIKLCPHKARVYMDDDFLDDVAWMVANNQDPKQPAIYLPPNLPEYFR